MRLNFLGLLIGLAYVALGVTAGYFVAHPFGIPASVLSSVLSLTYPLLGKFQGRIYADLGLAAFLYATPTILVIGIALGSVLHRVQHKRALVYSILMWPVFYFMEKTVLINLIKRSDVINGQSPVASEFIVERFGAEMSLYFVEYSLLLIILFATYRIILRVKPHTYRWMLKLRASQLNR